MSVQPTVVVMTRAPRHGSAKTRLQPLLGPDGCARLQHALLTHTAATAAAAAPTSLHIAVDPPQALAEVADLTTAATSVFAQPEGDLGARMRAAIAHVAQHRRGPMLVIGTDVPQLRPDHLLDACRRLEDGADVVFGPALDGGYYLVGIAHSSTSALDIDPGLWGGPEVLQAGVEAARAAGQSVAFLPPLRDLDTPDDARALAEDETVPSAIRTVLTEPTSMSGQHLPRVTIIVPVLNEAAIIETALARLRRDFYDCELLVVDGGSDDATADLAAGYARVLHSDPGRAQQMNVGARQAGGDVLWFVHADTAIEPPALHQLREAMADPNVVGGGLSLRFDRHTVSLKLLARMSDQRARRLHQVFGDQAMFVRRDVFENLGGFAALPLMEDFEFSRRLHRAGKMTVLTATSTASARRFTRHGTLRMIAFMQYLKLLFLAGVSPERIRLRYEAGPGIKLEGRRDR